MTTVILTKATEARDKTKTAEEEEKVRLAVAGALAEDNGDDIRQESLENELINANKKRIKDRK